MAQSRRTKEEVFLEAVQHFSGDFQEASRRKGDWLAASPVFVYPILATVYSGKKIFIIANTCVQLPAPIICRIAGERELIPPTKSICSLD